MCWQVLCTEPRTNMFGDKPVQAQNKAGLTSYSVPALDKRYSQIHVRVRVCCVPAGMEGFLRNTEELSISQSFVWLEKRTSWWN